jgi:hypothetical protein
MLTGAGQLNQPRDGENVFVIHDPLTPRECEEIPAAA